MASIARRGRPVEFDGQPLSVEQRLHGAHQQFMLLADLFDLHAAAPDYIRAEALSVPAAHALTALCRQAALDLRDLLDRLPPNLTNWTPAQGPAGSRRRGRQR
jgi:hypothetical protein